MTAPASTESALDWARSRLLVPGHPLSITLPYARPRERDRILALQAVITEIAAIPGQVGEPDVARQKLDWWNRALAEKLPHPAIQAWLESGVAVDLRAPDFGPLVEGVGAEIEPPRFEQLHELDHHCRRVAGPAAQLEARLVEPDCDGTDELDAGLVELAAAGYRVRMARDLIVDARQNRWLVPLELTAEYQLTRQQVAEGEAGHRLAALVRHLVLEAVQRIDRSIEALCELQAWPHRHQLLRAHLDRRLGLELLRRPGRIERERVSSTGPMAAFAVWREARRLRRGCRGAG